ncbi:Histidinol phosphatase and related hydrolases of the PHP family, partial [hydrothermal vent metagenome]
MGFMSRILSTVLLASIFCILSVRGNGQMLWASSEARHTKILLAKHWLAGDHHIHTIYSAEWDKTVSPPKVIMGGDANHSILKNAQMAERYGLDWMVITDHGGPNHSKLNLDKAYPDLQKSRLVVPGVLQFYGMEMDTPAAKHNSLIIPHCPSEAVILYDLEKK